MIEYECFSFDSMRLICLNIWGARQHAVLYPYLQKLSETTDIFCFQELIQRSDAVPAATDLRVDCFEELRNVLPDFEGYFDRTEHVVVDAGGIGEMGLGFFIRKSMRVRHAEGVYVSGGYCDVHAFRGGSEMPGRVFRVEVLVGDQSLQVLNFHGIGVWPKSDNPKRLEQSRKLKEVLRATPAPAILCGDFNIAPDTESIRIIGEGMKNLCAEFNIATTRNAKFSPDDHISDYIFTTPDIRIKKFEVPSIFVSDHLPLILDFEMI